MTIEAVSLSQEVLQVIARYDALRLHTYRDSESLHSRIRIETLGASTLLRFDDVGYFNRIYAADTSILSRLDEVERFYAGCPFVCELVASEVELAAACARTCERRGWTRGRTYSWMAAAVEQLIAPPAPSEFAIRRAEPGEEELFFTAYLSGFEADRNRFPEAVRNMRHLFQHDCLSFHLATVEGVSAGIGMTYADGQDMVFCAGATVPEFRNRGCHHALLAARVQLARSSNVRHVYGWCETNGVSERNMLQAGMENVGAITAWMYSSI
ncbi:MAG TPA: hypothetical protein VIM62_07240 [Acidobacteriaceae bacterium]